MANKVIFKIETPRGKIIKSRNKEGIVSARLIWNKGFGRKKRSDFNTAQDYLDAECLRLCEPLVPMDTKTLIKSGVLHTYIGSGEIRYKTPYARRVHYDKHLNFHGYPNRGTFWFDRMKALHSHHLLRMTERLVHGGK